MAKSFEDSLACKIHTTFCYLFVIISRYGGGWRATLMSYSDPHLLVGFWIILGGWILIVETFPYTIPIFILLIVSFHKYNQKKLSILYSIPLILGVVYSLNKYVENRDQRIADKESHKELKLTMAKNEELLSKNYIKYYDEEKKIICNETSRNDLFNFMLEMKPRYNERISGSNIAEFVRLNFGGREFVKKYPEFSNLNFNDDQYIMYNPTVKFEKYKFDLADRYYNWLDMYFTWKDISPSDLNTSLQNICKSTTDKYIQYVKNPNNFKKRN
jgi:hypothetical protein